MRILLFTGKGGVGKTTVAAATAVRAAGSGCARHLLDRSRALARRRVRRAARRLRRRRSRRASRGQQLDARAAGSRRRGTTSATTWSTCSTGPAPDTVEAEELAVVPGLDEVFALADIKAFADSGDYDLVVVDCAPTAETLRLLSLPDVLGWYMDRVFDAQRT